MYVPWAGRPRPALLPVPTPRPPLTFAAARLSAFATSCPADVQSGLPADAASLRETGSVDRLHRVSPWPIKSCIGCGAVSCEVSCLIMLSLMAPRVCTLVLSSSCQFSWLKNILLFNLDSKSNSAPNQDTIFVCVKLYVTYRDVWYYTYSETLRSALRSTVREIMASLFPLSVSLVLSGSEDRVKVVVRAPRTGSDLTSNNTPTSCWEYGPASW